MIMIGDQSYDLSDPLVLGVLIGAVLLLALFVMIGVTLGRSGRSARMTEAMADQMARNLGALGSRVEGLSNAQQQLSGGLTHVSEAQAASQAQILRLMEERLSKVTEVMTQNLSSTSRNTAQSLGELQQRLQVIDKAQENITKLSGDVLSLQDILSNKQTRGAFGEIQLHDIVSKALPPDSYSLQATLSNNRRADCLIHLPNPPGPIVIDSKFPLEAYEALRAARTDRDLTEAARAFRGAVRTHIKAISERYILEGETADGALMFLPSEAVYAEIHANFSDLVQLSFSERVWIVSPTTCMATLNTMRAILKDARMREQAGAIRKALSQLHRDVELVVERAGKLETHFDQARRDVEGITTAAERAGKRAARLDAFDFGDQEVEGPQSVVQLRGPE
ncbi:DNA recombination protein RmuC [Ponticoccus sp. SC2-23]|uniref:DNA recombination protein RmuC n=1 Tax=Alexandriicola marinus TaxID=2081710 RepID=UPI000FDB64B5|nr:DNA recombination protein RmuC [Alexandriicola marinus]MBM1220474.1 DNA recombination protein RmuC [Ponticoccus sp. SC6-9]MBM1225160.1 DNA recombination protein RmuC [Ponticoccus sp. SC6-15]MBM1228674.1 DNA recombination protein RmuC [Ponticoccus sp. SC6-38]MBM1233689.1 DNA recombination protein RmuC [Ponticoccus sp. SC6-45]MBM1239175.1 DNA recombination protein RmuC [Ponticoccus sp. SC6-49]MBM1242957.1 DNA recombination protein RmuC [Ponticoccus sp. SC2-64]MBM1247213.1 DNA recombination 